MATAIKLNKYMYPKNIIYQSNVAYPVPHLFARNIFRKLEYDRITIGTWIEGEKRNVEIINSTQD